MEKSTQIFGLRAIIEAINANEAIDKIFLQKGLSGDIYKELEDCSFVRELHVYGQLIKHDKNDKNFYHLSTGHKMRKK